jgi:hypothetical protein
VARPLSESERQSPRVSNTPRSTSDVSFRSFWAGFFKLFFLASAPVLALGLFCAVVELIAGRSPSSKDIVDFLRLELKIVAVFAAVALGAAILWIRDGVRKLTKTRTLNLEYLVSPALPLYVFDRAYGGETSKPLRRVFAFFLTLTVVSGLAFSVIFLPALMIAAVVIVAMGAQAWDAAVLVVEGAVLGWVGSAGMSLAFIACMLLLDMLFKFSKRLGPRDTRQPPTGSDASRQ